MSATITISVPDTLRDSIRANAKRLGVNVSHVCSNAIESRLNEELAKRASKIDNIKQNLALLDVRDRI